jgi:hypothetical protein
MQSQACFAYQPDRCRALAVTNCPGPTGCSFFKTTARLEQEKHQVWQYIQTLDEPKRQHIIDVYYGGQIQLLQGEEERP